MMRNTLAPLATAAVLVLSAGCTDLTTEPKSAVSSGTVFNDPSSYRAFLARLYGGLSVTGQQGPAGEPDIGGIDEGFSQYIRGLWQLQELPTDEAVIAWGDESLPDMNFQTWGAANRFVTAFYYRIFFQVAMVNEFLRETAEARLAERGASAELRTRIDQYRAEARFLRALSYWHGIDHFGGIPLVTETYVGVAPPQQATRQEVFNFVVSELNAVMPLLPGPGQGQYGRADQAAVQMLLAKLYLNAEAYGVGARWGDARAAVEAVIGSGAYQLAPNFMRNFVADNHTSPEIIFAVPFDGMNTRTWGGLTFIVNASVGGNNMVPSSYGVSGGWWGLRTTPQMVAKFPGIGGPDVRNSFFFTQGHSLEINNISDFHSGYPAPKFRNVTSTGAPGSHNTFPDTDFPMFRLADAYLMYAEAVVRGGGGSRAQALTYVNALRARAYGNTSGNITDGQLTLPFLIDERARELMWEAHRRTDLIRFGLFTGGEYLWAWKGGRQSGEATPATRMLYPIPAAELAANPNLTQNPGY